MWSRVAGADGVQRHVVGRKTRAHRGVHGVRQAPLAEQERAAGARQLVTPDRGDRSTSDCAPPDLESRVDGP
jgi:hypothetical protein